MPTAELASVAVNLSIGPTLAGGGALIVNNVNATTDGYIEDSTVLVNGDINHRGQHRRHHLGHRAGRSP